jgi:co-chaperonin GroES (HSP10)
METGLGDKLASGRAQSAQFGGAGSAVTDFEQDFAFLTKAEIEEKYGLSENEYDTYDKLRIDGQKLPDLTPVALQDTQELFSIADHRRDYSENPAVVQEKPKKFPEPAYEPLQTLMDRILVMVISDDPNVELLEDGSTRDKRTGLISTSKYRQHSNVGIVLLAGQWVVVSGTKTLMSDILKPGDKVMYGDYGSEKVPMSDEKAEVLCDSIGVNYEKTEQGLRVVRVQDVRTVERRIKSEDRIVPEYPNISGSYQFPGIEVSNG